MLRKVIAAIFIIVCFVLQCSVFDSLSFAGIIPNLLIILTSSFGFMCGEKYGLVIGFFCGLLNDIFFGSFLGFYALILMYIGFLNGKFSRSFYPEDIKLPLALIVVSDLSYGIICYILMFMLRSRLEFAYYFTGSNLHHFGNLDFISDYFENKPKTGSMGKKESTKVCLMN